MSEILDYCIGRPFPASQVLPGHEGALCIYAYGTQVHSGTIEEARKLLEYVNVRTGEENFIYKLVRIKGECGKRVPRS